MRRFLKLIKVWLTTALMAAQTQLLTDWSGALFIIGKVVRFLLYFIFIFRVMSATNDLASYNREQVVLFFLVFILIDSLIQFLFRGVYRFRFDIVSGDYDLHLSKPLPSFFRPVFGWTDVLDFITLIPLSGFIIWYVSHYQLFVSWWSLFLFLALIINSVFLGFSFHLFVCSIGILTTEVDHLVWIYRDLTSMARFPMDIYKPAIRWFLTFTIPVVILFTVPTKVLMGLLSWQWVAFSFLIGGVFLWASLKFWRYALTQYSSASS